MKKQNKDVKIQVRITPEEKGMLDELSSGSRDFSISKLVRSAINEKYAEHRKGK